MTLTYESDLYLLKLTHHAKYLRQKSFRMKVIVHTHTHTHTHITDRSRYADH